MTVTDFSSDVPSAKSKVEVDVILLPAGTIACALEDTPSSMIRVAVIKVFKVLRNIGLSAGYLASSGL